MLCDVRKLTSLRLGELAVIGDPVDFQKIGAFGKESIGIGLTETGKNMPLPL